MKTRFSPTFAAAIAAAAVLMSLPSAALSETAKNQPAPSAEAVQKWPGIVVSVNASATVSTQGMEPGGEIWGEWYLLPAGQAVTEPATAAKWVYMEMPLDGTAVVTGDPTPMCGSGVRQAGPNDRTAASGDVEVCNYAVLPGSRTENKTADPYVFAGLSVGGPWKEGMEDTGDLYRKVKGVAKSAHVTAAQFAEVEKEILKAGEMRLSIRRITLPPGGRLVTTDRYPTLRLVENGKLSFTLTEGSSAPAPKEIAASDTMEWDPANATKQVTLSNDAGEEVQFIEWSVAPAQSELP